MILLFFLIFFTNIYAKNTEKSVIATHKKEERVLVDDIEAVVHGSERSYFFCKSDLERRGIDSRKKNIDNLVSDELTYQDALKFKIPIDDTIVKDHLRRTLQMFGLKPGDELSIFAQEGYSYEEGFEQFRTMYAVNAMIDYHIKSNLVINEDEVLAYYNEHPIKEEAYYMIQTAFVPFDKEKGKGPKAVEKAIDAYIKNGKELDVVWSDVYRLQESEIASGLDFITTMNINDIQKQYLADGIQLYRLADKKDARLVPLKERYKQIVEQLRKPKFEKKLIEYQKLLRDNATVIFL